MFLEEGAKLESDALAAASRQSPSQWIAPEPEIDLLDPKVVDRMRPDVLARRAKFVRYVAAVCAGCVLVGLAALVKLMIQ
jgi:hypothetical protein